MMDGRPILTQAKLNIIKMEDFYDSQDYRAKQFYPTVNFNPKGINVGIQFKGCTQQYELEGENMYDKHGQGILALLPACCCSRSSAHSLESTRTMKRLNSVD
jgi:hypothetical protein